MDYEEMAVRVFRDGNEFCALIGPDLQEGKAGFGNTPGAALRALGEELDRADLPKEKAA